MKIQKEIELIAHSGLFDETFYLANNPDVKRLKVDPIQHFVEYGVKEKRNPSAQFDVAYYLEANPDVAKKGLNPFVHYIKYGQKEGRLPRYKYFLTLASCIRNEGKYLDEWLSYYIYQGVEHFYLNNDSSTDNTMEVLEPYIQKGYVTVYEGLRAQGILQGEFHDKIINEKKFETQWCCFFDVDEFFQGKQTIKELLPTFDDGVSAFELFWKFYGNSGHEKYEKKFMMERFTHYACPVKNPDMGDTRICKSIVRLKDIEPARSVHLFIPKTGIAINALFEDLSNVSWEKRLNDGPILENYWINHYYCKSREEYIEKINKGSCFYNNPKKWDRFHMVNKNDIEDDSMKTYIPIVEKIIFEITGEKRF